MRKELLNTQIKCESVEHGAEIVEFYKMNGFDTYDKVGYEVGCFYGVDSKGYFNNRYYITDIKTITLEQAKQLVATKDFSKMDIDEWLIETEKLGLSKIELYELIISDEISTEIILKLREKFNLKGGKSLSKFLYNKWNTSGNDLYTEITAYKLKDGTIYESKEDAENKAKEYKIAKELQEVFEVDKAMFIYDNLELIKKIINQ